MKSMNRVVTAEHTIYAMQLNCQLQQIAAMATRITYLQKPGRKQAEKALDIAIEMLDEY